MKCDNAAGPRMGTKAIFHCRILAAYVAAPTLVTSVQVACCNRKLGEGCFRLVLRDLDVMNITFWTFSAPGAPFTRLHGRIGLHRRWWHSEGKPLENARHQQGIGGKFALQAVAP